MARTHYAKCLLVLSFAAYVKVSVSVTETNLYADLMKTDEYDKFAPPAPNATDTVDVYFQLDLQQIVDVDEKNQVVEMNSWLNIQWYDFRLKWEDDPKYGHIGDLRFPANKLWKPDVLLFNSVDPKFDTSYQSNMIVNASGYVQWVPPGITRSSCKIDIKYFPFDDQVCYLKFGSWTYVKKKLRLNLLGTGVETKEYLTLSNDEWLLLKNPVDLIDYDYDGVVYQYLKIYFHLRRRTLYYSFNIIFPSLLVTIMSLVGFALPIEACEKIALETTVLLSILFCLSMVADVTPPTSESVPLLGIYFFCHMIIVTVSTVTSILILNFSHRKVKTHTMPNWTVNILLNWLPWLLMMKRPDKRVRPPPCIKKISSKRSLFKSFSRDTWCHICQQTDGAYHGCANRPFIILDDNSNESETTSWCDTIENRVETCLRALTAKTGSPDGVPLCEKHGGQQDKTSQQPKATMLNVLAMLDKLHGGLKCLTDSTPEDDEEEDVRHDWEFAGMVIDRMCLICFSFFIFGSTLVVLFSAPHLTM